MKTFAVVLSVVCLAAGPAVSAQTSNSADIARWKQEAQRVTIIRDNWGIPHVYGKSDADAVFGMIYAQSEDDFNRVETNFINAMGRLGEAEGASAIYQDLRMKMFIDPDTLRALYKKSPAWLTALMNAWADGLNYYLYTHPKVKPRVITRFEPWMALSFSEGSIGGDIEDVSLKQLAAFYGKEVGDDEPKNVSDGDGAPPEPGGSNGMAVAPSNTLDHRALLLINPHTSFFFRAELQMVSDEGLDAYGAVTWGQFFVYQGFNTRTGWMHTSSNADDKDEYLETVSQKNGRYYYLYGGKEYPMTTSRIVVPYNTATGMAKKVFTVYRTRHGPIVRKIGDKWVSIDMMNEPMKALIQSYTRTKALSYKDFLKTMQLHTNSTNNTIFADADGDIAYFHANFIPRRNPKFDWTKPVDGSDTATDWHGLLSVDQTPHLLNPASGWLYNSNNWPWSAAGPSSPKRSDYPPYVETGGESFRGLHAIRVLENRKDFAIDTLIKAAYDPYLTGFAELVPPLVRAYDNLPASDSLKARLAPQIDALRSWDDRWSATSVPTSLAVYWGMTLGEMVRADAQQAGARVDDYMVNGASDADRLRALAVATDSLTSQFGSWRTPWGEINRYQRNNGDIVQHFDDAKPSIPVGFTYSRWGSLASFAARPYPGTKKWYGTAGNSFVAVVEFGDSVRAKAITAGGESGDPTSPHFGDQAERYATGSLRPVYFYRSQLQGHTESTYHPGEGSAH
ncbi:MAG TPA: penicillin acylase family protein [Gemmatimonadaceae bacterium]|nr:penicillin acylase family protein [Gemmatimonadaceae bacterium]